MSKVTEVIRKHTLCKLGRHCPPHKRIQKFDGGRLPQLCCYCRLIVAWKGTDRRTYLHRSTEEEQ